MTKQKYKILEKIVLLIVGFLLTTVCGTYLQQRMWKNQWEIKKADINIAQKKEIFQHISSLLDRRLYRMRQFQWALQERFAETEREERRNEYREILYEWNENLNRNFALIDIHFGEELRDKFEHEIGYQFIKTGKEIELLYRKKINGEKVDITQIDEVLNSMHISIYHFTLEMLKKIQKNIDKGYQNI